VSSDTVLGFSVQSSIFQSPVGGQKSTPYLEKLNDQAINCLSPSRNLSSVLARKSIKQSCKPSEKVLSLMHDYKQMTNDAISIGLPNNVSAMKNLCTISYKQLRRYKLPSYFKLCAISKAAGILASRKKSMRRGFQTKDPYLKKLILVSCYGFKIINEKLRIPLGNNRFEDIPLVKHTLKLLSDPALKVNSFCLTENTLSLCTSKEVEEMEPAVEST
jgi:hypothetical protein